MHTIARETTTTPGTQQQLECWDWIERVLGRQLPGNDLGAVLKDGCVLCELINKMFQDMGEEPVIKGVHPPRSSDYELRDVCLKKPPQPPHSFFWNFTYFLELFCVCKLRENRRFSIIFPIISPKKSTKHEQHQPTLATHVGRYDENRTSCGS